MTSYAARASVEQWMSAHTGVIDFRRADAPSAGYQVKVGTHEVFLPDSTADQGVEAVRGYLRTAVEQAMIRKAENMEMAAAALRASVAQGVRIPEAE